MKIQLAVLAALSIGCVVAHVIGNEIGEITPRPGAVSMSLNTTSVNNIMQTFVPIMAYFALNGKSFPLDIRESGWLYSFTFNNLTVVEATGFTEKVFQYIEGTDKIHCRIGGVNVSTIIDADLEALHLIPFKASRVNITNMTLDFVIESTSADGVHWTLAEKSVVTLDNVDIEMDSSILNELVHLSSSIINHIIKNDLLPMLEKQVDGIVAKLNAMVANEQPYDFEVPVEGLNLNLTMTTAPRMKEGSDLIEVFFDGLFDMPKGAAQSFRQAYTGDITNYPPRLAHSNSEQFWIHEDTVDSMLRVAGATIFPLHYSEKTITAEFLSTFREVHAHYGADATIDFQLTLKDEGAAKPITFDRNHGVTFGGHNNDITSVIDVIVSNGTVVNETALTFECNLESYFNFTLKNLIIYPRFDEVSISNTKLTKDIVGLSKEYRFNSLATQILDQSKDIYNQRFFHGWALANWNPQLGMIGGILKNTTMTPYITDEWMFAGFEMQADLPNAVNPTLEFIQ